jgi:hypothetical protein
MNIANSYASLLYYTFIDFVFIISAVYITDQPIWLEYLEKLITSQNAYC